MSKEWEEKYKAFLAYLPTYQRKFLEHGFSSLTRTEQQQFDRWFAQSGECLPVFLIHWEFLSQLPAKLEERRQKLKQEMRDYSKFLEIVLPKPRRGRPANTKLAKLILELNAGGMSNREIRDALRTIGEDLSLEAVESYLKTRRRRRTE